MSGNGVSASAVYEGKLRHRRYEPVEHEFGYRHFMLLLDLDELPGVFDGMPLWSARRPAPARFRRSDHIGDPGRPLADCARELVEEHAGRRPEGPVRLLTSLRFFGVGFNPVSFLFAYDAAGERVEAVVADVRNTPWGERHPYVLARGDAEGRVLHDRMDKAFHVSPFQGTEDHAYDFSVSEPGESLQVHIESANAGRRVFDATLSLERRELTRARLLGLLAAYPPMGAATLARIYAHALRLKLKGAPYFRHPGQAAPR